MHERPSLTLELTKADKILEVFNGIPILVTWIWILHYYPCLPDTIPIHYNGGGEADRFSGKESIWSFTWH